MRPKPVDGHSEVDALRKMAKFVFRIEVSKKVALVVGGGKTQWDAAMMAGCRTDEKIVLVLKNGCQYEFDDYDD